jgi:peptidoglycan-associated lipoprotein
MRWSAFLSCTLIVAAAGGCHRDRPPAAPPVARAAPTPPPPAPAPAPPSEAAPLDEYSRIRALDLDSINRLTLLQAAYFDYDSAELRDDDRALLNRNAEVLERFDFLLVTIEGHCDERGSTEYNLALGERRARTVLDYLVSLGVPASRLKLVSYGKEVPLCREHDEGCWQRNRRAAFVVSGKQAGL